MKKSSMFQKLFLVKLSTVLLIFGVVAVSGQQLQHYNSPLYSPKEYDPSKTISNGLPEVLQKVGIEQRLNEQLPLETEFKNEEGKIVKLGDYFQAKRPVILALVYYECPMLCNEVLNGLTGTLKSLSFTAGKEFEVIAISFDAREYDKPDLAGNKKQGYVERYEREGVEKGLHFLTGTQESIDKITQAVGFNYVFDEKTNQFAHNGAIMIITPEGKISRYFYGIDYAPRDVKFGIMESAENKIGNPAEQLLLYCFHYDPSKGKYGLQILNVIRLGGIITIIALGAMLFVFWRKQATKN